VIGYARDERRFGPDYDEVELVLTAEAEHAFDVVRSDGMAAPDPLDPGIPGGGMELLELGTLSELPSERMLTAGRAHHQDLHRPESKHEAGWFEGVHKCGKEARMYEPGLDRHQWETEWAELEPLVVDSPAEALPEVDGLVARMMADAGYPTETTDVVDDEGVDPEVTASFVAAHEVAERVDRAETVDPGDVGQAIRLYREIYEHLTTRELDAS
jgi:hypothetical protein